MKRSMRRAEHAAMAMVNGRTIMEELKKALPEMITATEHSEPPVAAVSSRLLEKFGSEVKLLPVRQFIGIVIRALLEEAGYEVAYTGVRLRDDPVFRTGSVYRLQADSPGVGSERQEFLQHFFLRSLTVEDLPYCFAYLARRFPEYRDAQMGLPKPTAKRSLTPKKKRG